MTDINLVDELRVWARDADETRAALMREAADTIEMLREQAAPDPWEYRYVLIDRDMQMQHDHGEPVQTHTTALEQGREQKRFDDAASPELEPLVLRIQRRRKETAHWEFADGGSNG